MQMNVRNQVVQDAVQNPGVRNVGNQNGLIVVPEIANQNLNGNGNLREARAEGNVPRNNANLDEIEEVNANCILMANLQQASTSGTQTDKAPVYDSDRSAEVHNCDNCYDNEIFNMFTQEEQHTKLLKPIPEPLQVLQNDNNVILEVSEQKDTTGETSANTKFAKQSILGKPPSSSRTKLYAVTPIPKSTVFPKVGEMHALSKPVTSNSVPTPTESTVMNNERVISPGIFRINPFKAYRQCLITVNHDVCVFNYVNGMNSHGKKQKANVSNVANQKKHKAQIKRLQAQLGELKGKSSDTQCASNTLDPVFQKPEDGNMSLESQVLNYAKENAHLKTTYKNLFDSIKVTQAQTKSIIDSLQKQLYDTIYENAKLRS
nr:hypothetical protein [Tanacetum cinerariifolium]